MTAPLQTLWARGHAQHCMKCLFFPLHAIGADGQTLESKQVVYHYVDRSALYWELLPLLECNRTDTATLDVSHRVKAFRPVWDLLWYMLGWSSDEVLIPSKRSWILKQKTRGDAADDDEVPTELVREAWTISFVGVLSTLAYWSVHRKQRGLYLAKAWLEAVVAKFAQSDSLLGDLPEELSLALGQCQDGARDGVCSHMAPLLAGLAAPAQPTTTLVSLMGGVCRVMPQRPSARASMRTICEAIADRAEARVDALDLCDNALKASVTRVIGGRRRGWGESFKSAVMEGLSKRQKSQHASAICDVEGACPRRQSDWHWQKLASIRFAGKRCFTDLSGTFNVCSDGARLGKPAEDTNVYVVAHHGSGHAMWMLPQVIRSSKLRAIITRCLLGLKVVLPNRFGMSAPRHTPVQLVRRN